MRKNTKVQPAKTRRKKDKAKIQSDDGSISQSIPQSGNVVLKRSLQLANEHSKIESVPVDLVIEFLENYQDLVNPIHREPLKLISMKVPEALLKTFKFKAKQKNIPYQTQIKLLMTDWLKKLETDGY